VDEGITVGPDGRPRCWWGESDPLYRDYHDEEWGRPVHDERALFELLCLEGFQAGLSWLTILRKRPAFRAAFANFEPDVVAGWTDADADRLLTDPGIVRNRAKVLATLGNARALRSMHAGGETLLRLAWSFAPPARASRPTSIGDLAAETPGSRALSRALRERGFRFVGPTIVQAFMQSAGIVDDHLAGCWRAAG
jgi:DNA-3-methyladenine glycosylase I